MQACPPMVVIEITDKDCMHITGSNGQEKTMKSNVFTRSEKGRYCEQERNQTASAAVADDIDFGGGIAFS